MVENDDEGGTPYSPPPSPSPDDEGDGDLSSLDDIYNPTPYTPPCIDEGNNDIGYCISGNYETIWINGEVAVFDITILGTSVGNPTQSQLDEFEKLVGSYMSSDRNRKKADKVTIAAILVFGLSLTVTPISWPAAGGLAVTAIVAGVISNEYFNERDQAYINARTKFFILSNKDTPGIILP